MPGPEKLQPPVAALGSSQPSQGLIAGTSLMAERIRVHLWDQTPLGPIQTWSEALIANVNLILSSPLALAIYWGPKMLFLGNDASVGMIGPRPVEVLGLPAAELWGDHWHQMREQFEAVLSDGESFQGEGLSVIFPRDDRADEVFIDYSLSPIYDRGKVVAIFRTLQETTGNVIAMRALAESNERLRMALSVGNGFGVWDWNIRTGLVYADEIMARLYGIDPILAAAGTSHTLYERMLHPDDISMLSDAILQCILTGEEYRLDYRVRREDGTYRLIRSMGRCVYDEHGHAMRVTGLKTELPNFQTAKPLQPAAGLFEGAQWDLLPLPIRSFVAATLYFVTDHPEQIGIQVTRGPDATQIEIVASTEDLGKLIGKQGRTVRALRTLLLAVNKTGAHRYAIDIRDGRRASA